MNKDEIILKIIEVRKFQKEFFKTRDNYILQKCKKLEHELDFLLINYENQNAIDLFNQQ